MNRTLLIRKVMGLTPNPSKNYASTKTCVWAQYTERIRKHDRYSYLNLLLFIKLQSLWTFATVVKAYNVRLSFIVFATLLTLHFLNYYFVHRRTVFVRLATVSIYLLHYDDDIIGFNKSDTVN